MALGGNCLVKYESTGCHLQKPTGLCFHGFVAEHSVAAQLPIFI